MKIYTSTSRFIHSRFATHLTTFGDEEEHTHTYFEIVYVLSGTIEHQCYNHRKLLSRGSMFLLRPNDVHCFKRLGVDCCHRDIMIPKPLFRACCDFLEKTLYDRIVQRSSIYETEIEEEQILYFENILTHINDVSAEDSAYSETLILAAVVTLLSAFLRKRENLMGSAYPEWFQRLLDKFNKLEYLQGGIPSLIDDLSYNQIYICRVFKKFMNCTMTDYLNHARLKCAESFLRFTNQPISMIIDKIGFSSLSHFNTLFKKKYGVSPHRYRTLIRQGILPEEEQKKGDLQ